MPKMGCFANDDDEHDETFSELHLRYT
jgi:hypothetical protein